MGYELTEQMDWESPDVILYPTGGGTGLIGMWWHLMKWKKWAGSEDSDQECFHRAEGCAPIVRAFVNGWSEAPV
jgi:threonine synthase